MLKTQIEEKLIELNNTFDDNQRQLLLFLDTKDLLSEQMRVLENSAIETVTNAVDENGKPLYSNQTKRDIAKDKELSSSKAYFELNTNMSKISKQIRERQYSNDILKFGLKTFGFLTDLNVRGV